MIQHLIKSIDYFPYHLKMKIIEHLFFHYIPSVEIPFVDSNLLNDGKIFLNVPIKNKEETYEKIIKMSKKDNCATGNLLDYDYVSNHHKLIANPDLKQQINFIVKLGEDNAETMFFIIEKSEETVF